jgi:hypothetical protein
MSANKLSSPNTGLAASARAVKLQEMGLDKLRLGLSVCRRQQARVSEVHKDQRMSHTNQWHQMSWDANDQPRIPQCIADGSKI